MYHRLRAVEHVHTLFKYAHQSVSAGGALPSVRLCKLCDVTTNPWIVMHNNIIVIEVLFTLLCNASCTYVPELST